MGFARDISIVSGFKSRRSTLRHFFQKFQNHTSGFKQVLNPSGYGDASAERRKKSDCAGDFATSRGIFINASMVAVVFLSAVRIQQLALFFL
jgi:hypothetical protein